MGMPVIRDLGIFYAKLLEWLFHEVKMMKSVLPLLLIVAFAGTPAAAQDASPADTNEAPVAQETQPARPTEVSNVPALTAEPQKNEAPVHSHTGWGTLLKDTASDFVSFPKRPSTWVLLGVGAGAALATHPADDYVESHIVGNNTADKIFSVGKIVGSAEVQIGASVGLWAIGRYIVSPAAGEARTNRFSVIGFDLMRAQIISQAVVQGMKYSIRRDRPTGECCAFPSGHAATAFALASVLERHLGYRASWPALAAATYVATSRLIDDRHFLSDVMMGAGVGMASGWTVVGTHGRGGTDFALQPVPIKGGMMITFTKVRG